MIHKHLQTNIIRSNRCSLRCWVIPIPRTNMCSRWIYFGFQEPLLGSASIAIDVSGNREPLGQQFLRRALTPRWIIMITTKQSTYLRILFRGFQKQLEVLITRLLMIFSLTPLRNSLAVPNEDMEESVQKQNIVRFDGYRI